MRTASLQGGKIYNQGFSANWDSSSIDSLVFNFLSNKYIYRNDHVKQRISQGYYNNFMKKNNRNFTIKDLISCVKFQKGKVVEFETIPTKDKEQIYKVVVRYSFNESEIVVVIQQYSSKLVIKTAWENLVSDNHSTLHTEGIEKVIPTKIGF